MEPRFGDETASVAFDLAFERVQQRQFRGADLQVEAIGARFDRDAKDIVEAGGDRRRDDHQPATDKRSAKQLDVGGVDRQRFGALIAMQRVQTIGEPLRLVQLAGRQRDGNCRALQQMPGDDPARVPGAAENEIFIVEWRFLNQHRPSYSGARRRGLRRNAAHGRRRPASPSATRRRSAARPREAHPVRRTGSTRRRAKRQLRRPVGARRRRRVARPFLDNRARKGQNSRAHPPAAQDPPAIVQSRRPRPHHRRARRRGG